ncbi:MAG: acyltransferase [Chloroflexi bacterium]|nr:acyltransferase [Chloroflexota bacterium]
MRIKGLDGLRGIAFLMVFFFHIHWVQWGWLGVQLFFVLSGFLITGILMDMKEALPAKPYFIKFYGRRVLRIFPLYYFYLAVMWALTAWALSRGFHPDPMTVYQSEMKYALIYVYDFYFTLDRYIPSYFLTHFWTLAVEEQFYLFWPLFIFITPRKYMRKAFWFVIALAPILRLITLLLHSTETFSFLRDDVALVVYSLPFTHLDAFAMGALFTLIRIPKAKGIFIASIIASPLIGLAADYIVNGRWKDISIASLGWPITMPDGNKFIWGYTIVNGLCAVLLYGVARHGWFTRLLEWPPLRYLGKISYGMYVYHFAIVWLAATLFGQNITEPFAPLLALATFTFIWIVATLSYQLMEKPIIDLKDRFFEVPPERIIQNPEAST